MYLITETKQRALTSCRSNHRGEVRIPSSNRILLSEAKVFDLLPAFYVRGKDLTAYARILTLYILHWTIRILKEK